MANDILYDLTPWQDAPSTLTPINAENLNERDSLLKKVVDKTNQIQEQLSDAGVTITDDGEGNVTLTNANSDVITIGSLLEEI